MILSTISKVSLLPIVIASILVMSGCNKSDTNTESATANTESATMQSPTNDISEPTPATLNNENATAKVVGEPMAKMGIYTLAQSLGNQITEKQRSCLLDFNNSDNSSDGQAELLNYLSSNLTPEELKASDDFFASPIGVKLYQQLMQQFATLKGEPVTEPVTLTPEEQAQLEAFQSSPVAIKINTLFRQQDNAKFSNEWFKPLLVKKFKHCNINLEVPDL